MKTRKTELGARSFCGLCGHKPRVELGDVYSHAIASSDMIILRSEGRFAELKAKDASQN